MNERIKELAEQAGLSEGVFTRHDGVPCNLKGYSMLPDEMEKFAELIVRECAKICDTKRNEYTKLCKDSTSFEQKNIYGEGEFVAHQVRLLIQAHFGVEE